MSTMLAMMADWTERAEKWITVKASLAGAAVVGGWGMLTAESLLTVLGVTVALLTGLAQMVKIGREILDMWHIRQREQRERRMETRQVQLDKARIPGRDPGRWQRQDRQAGDEDAH
ncbi:MAG: hypothetical protein KDI44_02565 [Thiothrix sp.]|nr:hypothetical protein [Thiothrix sp.]